MITLKDCLDYCDLSEHEVIAIAEHDHEPIILGIAHGECMLSTREGRTRIKQYILDEMSYADALGNAYQVQTLRTAYETFDATHRPSQKQRAK